MAIRVKATQKLVAFISAVPSLTRVKVEKIQIVDINFLCIHKKLRSKRLAPVLIKVMPLVYTLRCTNPARCGIGPGPGLSGQNHYGHTAC